MSQTSQLIDFINSTLQALKQSDDYSDQETTTNFMILTECLIDFPNEIANLSNQQLANLSICLSCMQTSDFTKKYPTYYEWNSGRVISAVGFYSYMKQLDNAYLLNAHYPSFIVLIHDGRNFITDLFLNTSLKGNNSCDEFEKRQEAEAVTKYFECLLHVTCNKAGCSDAHTENWFNELKRDIDSIKYFARRREPFEDAKKMYRMIANSFESGIMPDYCKTEQTNNISFTFYATRCEVYQSGQLISAGPVRLKINGTSQASFIQIELLGSNRVVLPQNFEFPIGNNPADPDEIEDRTVYGRLQSFYFDRESRTPVVMEMFKNKPCIRFALPSLELIEYYGSYE